MRRMPLMRSVDVKRNLWKTPKNLYDSLNEEFHFDFDPCPCYPIKFDGLAIEWGTSNFVNPPYDEIYKWILKAMAQSKKRKSSVFLIPARTGSRWFHELVLPEAKEIRFMRGRVNFKQNGEKKSSPPFDSMIVIFKGKAVCKEESN
jgi:site-specific DNA-methyltransferase (adenine-specific)